jgi:hypothetical protein
MEFKPKAMAEVAGMAAMTANANAVHARLAADSAAAYARRLEIDAKAKAYGFSHDDVLRALDAAAMPKFAVGGLYPGDIPVSKAVAAAYVTTSQPSACNPSPDAARLMAELVAEMRALRQDHAQMAALLSRWDGHGLPAARHYGEMIIPKPPRWDGSGHGERA